MMSQTESCRCDMALKWSRIVAIKCVRYTYEESFFLNEPNPETDTGLNFTET